ncbi:MAG: Spy/CpxP family protein refolding chaperone [Reyranella sp.]
MSSRLIQVLLALSLLLNTFVLAGFVYRSWIEPPAFERHLPPPPPPGQRPSPLEMMAHDLNLDDGQRQALRAVFEQYSATRRERLREIQKVREQIGAEYKNPTVDIARVDTLIDQLTKLRAEQQKEYLGSLNQLAAQLKPEQRDRMHQILAERLAMPFGQRPPGGGPGPGPGRPPQ